jgi:ankyrin repeat protein
MPKKNKDTKGKRQKAGTAAAQTDDSFDDMLAELCAADLATLAVGSITTTSSSSSSSNPTVSDADLIPTAGETVPEAMIILASFNGDMDLLRRLARRGIRVSSALPLCRAAENGKLDAVRLLVKEMGADVGQVHKDFTALRVAALEGQEHVVRCLVLEFGADVNQSGENGATALYAAAQNGHEHVVRCLLCECNADVNTAMSDGCTALYAVAQEGNEHVVRCLVKKFGADVNIAIDGCTPLMTAAESKHHKVVVG